MPPRRRRPRGHIRTLPSGRFQTLGQAQWLDVAELEETTRTRYADLIRIYIEPTFGELAASKPDAELLEADDGHWPTPRRDRRCAGSSGVL